MKLRGKAVALASAAALAIVSLVGPAAVAADDDTSNSSYATQITTATGYSPGTSMQGWANILKNDFDYEHTIFQCYKTERKQDGSWPRSGHGSVSGNNKTVTLNTFDPSWVGDNENGHWSALIIKAGSAESTGNKEYKVVEHPTAGTAYAAATDKDISFWVVCKGYNNIPTFSDPSCVDLKVDFQAGDGRTSESVDVNVTIRKGGTESETKTLTFRAPVEDPDADGGADGYTGGSAYSGYVTFDFLQHPVFIEAGWEWYYVDWVQVQGYDYHFTGSIECGEEPETEYVSYCVYDDVKDEARKVTIEEDANIEDELGENEEASAWDENKGLGGCTPGDTEICVDNNDGTYSWKTVKDDEVLPANVDGANCDFEEYAVVMCWVIPDGADTTGDEDLDHLKYSDYNERMPIINSNAFDQVYLKHIKIDLEDDHSEYGAAYLEVLGEDANCGYVPRCEEYVWLQLDVYEITDLAHEQKLNTLLTAKPSGDILLEFINNTPSDQSLDGIEPSLWDGAGLDEWSHQFVKVFGDEECEQELPEGKVQICHATASQTHPYANPENHEVSWKAIDNNGYEIEWNGHGQNDAGNHANDIIPPFSIPLTGGGTYDYPGKNWTALGQAIFNNGCELEYESFCEWDNADGSGEPVAVSYAVGASDHPGEAGIPWDGESEVPEDCYPAQYPLCVDPGEGEPYVDYFYEGDTPPENSYPLNDNESCINEEPPTPTELCVDYEYLLIWSDDPDYDEFVEMYEAYDEETCVPPTSVELCVDYEVMTIWSDDPMYEEYLETYAPYQEDTCQELPYCEYTDGTIMQVLYGVGEEPEGSIPWENGSECAPETEEPTLAGTFVGSLCLGDVPYIDYSVNVTNPELIVPLDAKPVVTFLPDADELVYSDGSPIEPLVVPLEEFEGTMLWPGAGETGGTPTGWPGWALNDEGEWEDVGLDNFGWTRDGAVRIDVNPSIVVQTEYPEPTPDCVAGPEVETEVLGAPPVDTEATPARPVTAEATYTG